VAAVINVLRNEPRRPALRLDLSARGELSSVGDGIRSLSIYDQLATRPTHSEMACPARPELVDGEFVERAEAACPEFIERAEGMVF